MGLSQAIGEDWKAIQLAAAEAEFRDLKGPLKTGYDEGLLDELSCDSIRLAVLTVSPHRSNENLCVPITPATTGPQWTPIRTSSGSSRAALLETLHRAKLILDWRKKQQSRAAVRLTIEEVLDRLPEAFDKALFDQKCDLVFQHVYESYHGAGKSVYGSAA